MFSVSTTSKSAGREISCIAALSTSRCSSRTPGWSRATRSTVSRHRREVSRMFALSTEVTRPRRAGDGRHAERQLGDPLDLLDRVDAGVVGDAVAAAAVAEVDPAGQLAHDQQVGAPDALLAQRARARRAPGRSAPAAGSRTARGPCAGPSRPCSGRGASGSVVSHFGPPTAPSSTASAARQRSSTSGQQRRAVLVDRDAADRQLLDLEAGAAARGRARPAAAARRRRPRGRCRRPAGRRAGMSARRLGVPTALRRRRWRSRGPSATWSTRSVRSVDLLLELVELLRGRESWFGLVLPTCFSRLLTDESRSSTCCWVCCCCRSGAS